MKYKRLGLIVAFCFASWLVLAFVIFNENAVKKIDVEVILNFKFIINLVGCSILSSLRREKVPC
jgi:hypothetical protein